MTKENEKKPEPTYDEVCKYAHDLQVRLDAVGKERDHYRKEMETAKRKLKTSLEYITVVDRLGAHLQKCPKCMELQDCEKVKAIYEEVSKNRKAMRDLFGKEGS